MEEVPVNKREALATLIQNSYILDEETKNKMLANIDAYTQEEIDAIGTFLAEEKKAAIENAADMLQVINNAIKEQKN